MRPRANPWLKIGLDAWSLGLEASGVAALRMMKLAAGGPAAEAESRRMVAEKMDALQALQVRALTGALGVTAPAATARTLAHYRRRVRANRRRLAKG